MAQDRVRKDIECAFGVVIQRFKVLQRPYRGWYLEDIVTLLHTCVILHNMVTESCSGSFDSYDNNEFSANDLGTVG
jgi:Plant transposon protein